MIITPFLLFFMSVVFVLLVLFLNTVDKRKWLTVLISLVLTPFVYFFMFYPFVNIISNYHHQKYFNSNAWAENPELRYEMIDNTIASDTLIGATKATVIKQLGNYEWLSWDNTKEAHNPNQWNYNLGIEPGAFNTDKECVRITFEANKVVALKSYTEPVKYETKRE